MVAANKRYDWAAVGQRDYAPPPPPSGYVRGLIVGLVYGTAIGVILQSAFWR